MFAETWEWFANNWGNLASVIGLVLAVPSLIYSYLAWEEAKSVEESLGNWKAREERKLAIALAMRLHSSIKEIHPELRKRSKNRNASSRFGETWSSIVDDLCSLAVYDSIPAIKTRSEKLANCKLSLIGVSFEELSTVNLEVFEDLRATVAELVTSLERELRAKEGVQ
jgi:hypothetical protein